METDHKRREFLISLAGLGGAVLTIPRILRGELPSPDEDKALGPEQSLTIAAAVERILPGAGEAGVPDYIAYWLADEHFAAIRRYLSHGAVHLDRAAKSRHKKTFASCDGDQMDAILKEFAEEKISDGKFDGLTFFKQLVELTLEGFLSDPNYGGNRDRVGWRFIGVPDGLGSCWWNPDGVEMLLSPDTGFHD